MTLIIDGKDARMGRLASVAAKAALKGEEVVVLNCKDVIITGNKKTTQEDFLASRGKVGTTQRGPKVSRLPHLIVKRAIRGMLPNVRQGRARSAFARIRCYATVPKEFESKKTLSLAIPHKQTHIRVKELSA